MNSYDLVCKVHEVPTFGPWMWAELLSRQWAERSLGILFICSRPGKGPVQFSSVAQLCWILFDPQGLQHTRLPCPSPTPGVYPNSCPSNHLIFCRPLRLLPSIFSSVRVFSNESALHIRWPKRWSFSFKISPSNEHSGLISFRMDWFDLPAVQGILKSLLQHHSSKASILRCSAFFFFFFKFYFIFKLYITVLVLPNLKMNPPQVYMCSPSWTLLPPPSPFHPSGSSQCTSPSFI